LRNLKNQVWVCGEALIDLIFDGKKSMAIVGGGPANTAKALSKLGIATQFIDGLSNDEYGQMILRQLKMDGVFVDFVQYSNKPTCIANVNLDEKGKAIYDFQIKGTATFDFSKSWLPDPQLNCPSLLHIGTLVTVIEPTSSILFEWVCDFKGIAPIIFDPNVRPAVLSDRYFYLDKVERWVSISDAVKVSDEDLNWLYPSISVEEISGKWLSMGPKLVVVTLGDKGLIGFRKNEKVYVSAEKVRVADTVGAGDTVGAVLVEAILKNSLDNLSGSNLELFLARAAKAASITVSRFGAIPPTSDEI
jgi:fructokinase